MFYPEMISYICKSQNTNALYRNFRVLAGNYQFFLSEFKKYLKMRTFIENVRNSNFI